MTRTSQVIWYFIILGPVATAGAMLVSGCHGGNDRRSTQATSTPVVMVVARDHLFVPDRLELEPGQAVEIRFRNEGKAPHGIAFALPGGQRKLGSPVPPGGSASMWLAVPSQPGDYRYYCPIDDHQQREMAGTLVVQRPTLHE